MAAPLETMSEAGLTSISDIMANPGFDLAFPWLFQALEEANALPLRVHYYVPIFALDDIEAAAAYAEQYDTERLRFAGGKVWVDGAISAADGWVLDPLVDTDDDFGVAYFDESTLVELIARAEAASLSLKLHTNADGAVQATLDAFEAAAAANGGLKQAHALEHVVLVAEEDRLWMAELGIVASVQPAHQTVFGLTDSHEAWGEERQGEVYNLRGFADDGVTVALGTDWPVWPTLSAPVSLWAASSVGAHTLTPAEALTAYTAGSAAAVNRDDELGCLLEGCLADITVLDGDPIQSTASEISQLKVKQVWVGGERVR